MKITVFTLNQPRHVALIHALAAIADEVYAVQECMTIFPGKIADFVRKTEVMQEYFSHVIDAEAQVFGNVRFSPPNVRTLTLKDGDLTLLDIGVLEPALHSDYYIVNGASYIKGDLINLLIEKKAVNIHLGVSPYFRGGACNFWALYDGYPELVGATIHYLAKGLDTGAMLFHALPPARAVDPFIIGMLAVKSAYDATVEGIQNGTLFAHEAVPQDKEKEIRYSRNVDFTDEVALDYLHHKKLTPQALQEALANRDLSQFVRPYIPQA